MEVTKLSALDAWETVYNNKYCNLIVNNELGSIKN